MLAMEVDRLSQNVNQQRVLLEQQREHNKAILQRYEDVYEDVTRRFGTADRGDYETYNRPVTTNYNNAGGYYNGYNEQY